MPELGPQLDELARAGVQRVVLTCWLVSGEVWWDADGTMGDVFSEHAEPTLEAALAAVKRRAEGS